MENQNKEKMYLMVKSYPAIENVYLEIVMESDVFNKYSDIKSSKFYEIESIDKLTEGLKEVSVRIEVKME